MHAISFLRSSGLRFRRAFQGKVHTSTIKNEADQYRIQLLLNIYCVSFIWSITPLGSFHTALEMYRSLALSGHRHCRCIPVNKPQTHNQSLHLDRKRTEANAVPT